MTSKYEFKKFRTLFQRSQRRRRRIRTVVALLQELCDIFLSFSFFLSHFGPVFSASTTLPDWHGSQRINKSMRNNSWVEVKGKKGEKRELGWSSSYEDLEFNVPLTFFFFSWVFDVFIRCGCIIGVHRCILSKGCLDNVFTIFFLNIWIAQAQILLEGSAGCGRCVVFTVCDSFKNW